MQFGTAAAFAFDQNATDGRWVQVVSVRADLQVTPERALATAAVETRFFGRHRVTFGVQLVIVQATCSTTTRHLRINELTHCLHIKVPCTQGHVVHDDISFDLYTKWQQSTEKYSNFCWAQQLNGSVNAVNMLRDPADSGASWWRIVIWQTTANGTASTSERHTLEFHSSFPPFATGFGGWRWNQHFPSTFSLDWNNDIFAFVSGQDVQLAEGAAIKQKTNVTPRRFSSRHARRWNEHFWQFKNKIVELMDADCWLLNLSNFSKIKNVKIWLIHLFSGPCGDVMFHNDDF